MAVTARRKITVTLSGDVDGEQEINAANNTASPGYVQIAKILAGQTTTFGVPDSSYGPVVATAVTILKDPDYAGTLILKGASSASDAEGIYLHPTDPDTISVDAANQTGLALKASADCAIRLIWS